MGAVENLLNTQLTILILILAGFLLAKSGVVTVELRKGLADFIINFIMPCNIIKSFMIEFDEHILRSCLAVFLISCATQLLVYVLSRVLYRRADGERRPSLRFSTMVSNAGFLGNPIVESLYGSQGLLYASIYLIPQRIVMWSAGVTCYTDSKGEGVLRKALTHPCIVAVFVGLGLMLTQLQLPAWLDQPLKLAGSSNTPLSLLVIGAILAEVDPKSIVSRQSLGFCLIRLAVIPLVILAGCTIAGADSVVTQVSTVLGGMPAPLITAILASKYDKDERFSVSLVFLSTVLSMVSLPLLCLLMLGI